MCIQNNVNQSLAVLMHNPRWPPLVSREAVISLSTNYIVFTFWCTHSPVQLEVICHVALEQTHNMSSYVLVITNINSFLRSSMYCLYCKATALEPIWSTKNQFESSASGSKHPRYVHIAWSWMQLQNGTFIDATTCDYAVVSAVLDGTKIDQEVVKHASCKLPVWLYPEIKIWLQVHFIRVQYLNSVCFNIRLLFECVSHKNYLFYSYLLWKHRATCGANC